MQGDGRIFLERAYSALINSPNIVREISSYDSCFSSGRDYRIRGSPLLSFPIGGYILLLILKGYRRECFENTGSVFEDYHQFPAEPA